MTTRDTDKPKTNGDGRAVRPKMARTHPKRSIVNAFYQPDASGQSPTGANANDDAPMMTEPSGTNTAKANPINGAKFEDEAVWGKQSTSDGEGSPHAATAIPKSKGLWDDPFDAVRAAYGVVNEQIKAGYEEATKLNADGIAPTGRNITKILNRLLQTYSDLGTQWVDLIRATAENREKAAAAPATAPDRELSIAVELTTSRPAKARALLYRSTTGALSIWPLRRDGGDGDIADVTIAPGPVATIEISPSARPGLYRGIIIEDGAEEPAGSVILNVLGGDDD